MARTPLASLHHEDADTEDESHMPQYGSERHKDPASLVTAKTGTILMRGRSNFLCWLTNLTLLWDFILLTDIVVTLKDNTPEGELSEPLWCPEMMRDRYKRAGRLKWGGVADAQQWPVGWLPFLGGALHLVRTGHLTLVSWLGFSTTLDIILLLLFFLFSEEETEVQRNSVSCSKISYLGGVFQPEFQVLYIRVAFLWQMRTTYYRLLCNNLPTSIKWWMTHIENSFFVIIMKIKC